MYSLEKTRREDGFLNPSFSSTLLDKIYRSIDETTGKKQSRSNGKCGRALEEEEKVAMANETSSLRRARLLQKWMDKKSHNDHDRINDQHVLFFSSTSSSSDSSSGGSSSSDTESMFGVRSRASCLAPYSRPKQVRTSVCEKSDKTLTERRQQNSSTGRVASNEEGLIKSKSRAMKIYNNLKKVKQPISPGGKLTNFVNSLFATKKTKSTCSVGEDLNAERKGKSGQASTCSSAPSFSRSCLSKASPSSRDKLRNGVKRTVSFYPVSVIVDEDSRPCGHKCLYEEEDASLVPVSKIGPRKNEQELMVMEEAAREFLKEYHRNQKKSDLILRDDYDDDDDDDAASYSSSDLFELDHLAVMGNNRYHEELPVYETTHVSTNRAIANGLIM